MLMDGAVYRSGKRITAPEKFVSLTACRNGLLARTSANKIYEVKPTAVSELTDLGKDMGVEIRIQKNEIFNAMHQV